MIVRLSTKGQLVIPRKVRERLGLRPGAQIDVRIEGKRIVLEPLSAVSPLEALHGRYAGDNLLGRLESEHQEEIAAEQPPL